MMRVGEMLALRYRDCRVEKNTAGEKILICEVQGKRGGRTVVGRSEAVEIYERRQKQAEDSSPRPFSSLFTTERH